MSIVSSLCCAVQLFSFQMISYQTVVYNGPSGIPSNSFSTVFSPTVFQLFSDQQFFNCFLSRPNS